MLRHMILSLLVISLLFSCGDSSELDTNTPTNLTLEITNIDDGSGLVEVVANAENAVSYTMSTGDDGIDLLMNTDGQFSHTYSNTGTYTILVTATGSSGATIDESEVIVVNSGAPEVVGAGYSTPINYFDKNLIWNEEFNGTSLNEQFWSHDIGDGCPDLCGWGNNELEYYRSQNTSVGGGLLTIEAKRETFENRSYTSGKILTRDKQSFQYGRIDIRAKMPEGQGMWPALWLLGDNLATVGWPRCGEIDVLEMRGGGGRENQAYGTAHWDQNGNANFAGTYELSSGTFADEFHVFSIVWDENFMRWYVDDQLYNTLDISSAALSEFRAPFFFVVNLAVGGNFPGSPGALTVFPQTLEVDYIRYFQDK